MNILCSCDVTFLYPLENLIFSLSKTQSEKIDFYFYNAGIEETGLSELKQICEKLGLNFILCPPLKKISEGVLTRLKTSRESILKNQNLSLATYYRIFIDDYLPKNLDRILWLDADCLVQKDLKDFYELDFRGNAIAAADHTMEKSPNSNGYFGYDMGFTHFNAGIILFNLKKIFEEGLLNLHKIYPILFGKNKYNDQSALNEIFKNKVKWVHPLMYNFSSNQDYMGGIRDQKDYEFLFKKAYIIHYASIRKPWLSMKDKFAFRAWHTSENEFLNFLKENNIKPLFKDECQKCFIRGEILTQPPDIFEACVSTWHKTLTDKSFREKTPDILYSGFFSEDTIFSDCNKDFSIEFKEKKLHLNFGISPLFKEARYVPKNSVWGLIKLKASQPFVKNYLIQNLLAHLLEVIPSLNPKDFYISENDEIFFKDKKFLTLDSKKYDEDGFSGWIICYIAYSFVDENTQKGRKHPQIGILDLKSGIRIEDIESIFYCATKDFLIHKEEMKWG